MAGQGRRGVGGGCQDVVGLGSQQHGAPRCAAVGAVALLRSASGVALRSYGLGGRGVWPARSRARRTVCPFSLALRLVSGDEKRYSVSTVIYYAFIARFRLCCSHPQHYEYGLSRGRSARRLLPRRSPPGECAHSRSRTDHTRTHVTDHYTPAAAPTLHETRPHAHTHTL